MTTETLQLLDYADPHVRYIVEMDADYGDGEFLGEMRAEFPDPEVREKLAAWSLVQWNGLGEESRISIMDDEESPDGVITNADYMIAALCVARSGALGDTVRIRVGYASWFWFFHDLDHSRHDFSLEEDRREVLSPLVLEAAAEDRANLYAAKKAHETGAMTRAQITSTLASLREDFRERFKVDSEALYRFFDDVEDVKLDDDDPDEWGDWVETTVREALDEDDPESYVDESADGAVVYDADAEQIAARFREHWDLAHAQECGTEPENLMTVAAFYALYFAAMERLEELQPLHDELREAREDLADAGERYAEALAEWKEALG